MLYERQKAVEAQKVEAEAQLYAVQQAAELYAKKKKEAKGMKALAKAQGFKICSLLTSLGGNYNAFKRLSDD